MRPRDIPSGYKIHTPTWGSEVDNPSRHTGLRNAIRYEEVANGNNDDDADLQVGVLHRGPQVPEV